MSDLTRFTGSTASGELAGLLIADLIEHIPDGVARQTAGNALHLMGVGLKKEGAIVALIQEFAPEAVDAQLARLAILLVNYGALIALQTISPERLQAGLIGEPIKAIPLLWRRGWQQWQVDRVALQALIDANTFPAGKFSPGWLSLFAEEDEKQLKLYFRQPPLSPDDWAKQARLIQRLRVLRQLADALALPTMYARGIRYADPNYPDHQVYHEFRELDYIRLSASRPTLALTTTKAGVLAPTIGSLLMRLLVAVVKNDDLWQNNFSRDASGRLRFKEAPLLVTPAERQTFLQAHDISAWEVFRRNSIMKNIGLLVGEFLRCFAVRLEICRDFLILMREPATIEQHLPLVAEAVQAILESDVWELLGLAADRPQLTDDDLRVLSDEFLARVVGLQDEIKLFFSDDELRRGETINEHAAAFWQRRVLLEIGRQAALLPRDRILAVRDICQLTDLTAVVFHLSNFDTWPQSMRDELVGRRGLSG